MELNKIKVIWYLFDFIKFFVFCLNEDISYCEEIIVKCLVQGHKCQDWDLHTHSSDLAIRTCDEGHVK